MIIGFTGLPGSGKDTMARKMASDYPNSYIISFADPLKEMAWDILKWKPRSEKEYREFKEGKIDILPGMYDNGRQFLEVLSDVVKKQCGNEVFLNMLVKKIDSLGEANIFIPDVRFPMEFNLIRSYNESKIFWCNYKAIQYNPNLYNTYNHNSQIETLALMNSLHLKHKNIHGTLVWDSKW